MLGPEFSAGGFAGSSGNRRSDRGRCDICRERAAQGGAISRQVPGLVLADDSGLEVDSLGGAPGVFSARYAGAEASDEANRQKLLVELAKRGPDSARMARFHCALALARDGRVLAICEGSVEGEIVRQARGSAGFGYDPLFQPNEFSRDIR
jgi:XTP/dITP diphosphohydrolase